MDKTGLKKRKISELRASIPFCSQSALAAICKAIEEGGLPEKHTRFDIWKETKDFLEDGSMSMYGPLFQTSQATTLKMAEQTIVYINFLSLLSGAFSKGGAFTDFLLHFHSFKPSSYERPWEAVCYTDEMHPGNMLNSSSRKAWCFYISFLQFEQMLSRSDMWFCISIIRSSEVGKLQAGYSQVFRLILEGIFGGGEPNIGVLLKSPKGNLKLFFTLGMVLQDGSAHKQVFANRQDTGSKPCFHCSNIFQLRSDKSEEDDSKVFSKFLRYEQLQIATDEEMVASWKRLEDKSRTASQAEFNQLQQASGLSFNTYALMSSAKLEAVMKPISMYCFDYMHALCSHGVINDLTFLILESINKSGINVWEQLHSWMQLWILPKAYSTCSLDQLFQQKNIVSYKKAKTLKISASEVLSLYKPMKYYLQVMILANNVMVDQCVCFVCWADVLDFLVSIPFLHSPSPRRLLMLVEQALQATVQAGFGGFIKPKAHWCLHLADGLQMWSQLPSCWALERKHKQPRKFGGSHHKLSTYERGLLSAVTMEHLSSLMNDASLFKSHAHVVDCKPPSKKLIKLLKAEGILLEAMQCSNTCRLECGTTCTTNDVAFLDRAAVDSNNFTWGCGKIKHFLILGSLELCIVDVLKFKGCRAGTQSSKWQAATESLRLIHVKQVLQPVVHTEAADGTCTCLTPAPLSSFLWKNLSRPGKAFVGSFWQTKF